MTALERFHQVVQEHHKYAREWKARTGGQVFGYLCVYTPEEIMYAAGILPVKIQGSHEPQEITDRHIYYRFCAYCRDALAQGLQGRYDYLDGITHTYVCSHIRQTYSSWILHVPTPFHAHLQMPLNPDLRGGREYFRSECARFKSAIEEWTGKPIASEALWKAIEVYNTNRRLMRQIYELRKADNPPISGAEAMEMVLASMFMDKAEHNQLLLQALEEFKGRQVSNGSQPRLILVSSEVDDVDLLRLVESLGGIIVIDDNCIGSRYFWNEAPTASEPLEAIVSVYMEKPICPMRDMVRRVRNEHVLNLAQSYRAQGAVTIIQKFCGIHAYDMPSIKATLKLPTLSLECDMVNPAGQFRTRIEAFLEMLQAEIT